MDNIFVVDLGFSAAKWLFKSLEGKIKASYRKGNGDNSYQFGNDSYIVGEKALYLTGSNYLRTVDELTEFYPLFVGVCALKAGIQATDNLAVGLPYDYYTEELAKLKKGSPNSIEALQKSLSEIKINNNSFKFRDVYIFPQGLGGIKAYLSNNKVSGNILAIDLGFNTVIYNLYNADESEIITGKTFYKKGIHDMAVNKLMPRLKKHIQGKTLSPIEIDHVIVKKVLQHGIDQIDVSTEINEAIHSYMNDLLAIIIGDLKENLGGVVVFDTILLFGGGVYHVKDMLSSSKVKVEILTNPEFANAEGFRIKVNELIKKHEG